MSNHLRDLDAQNIDLVLANYESSFADVGHVIQGLTGKDLIETLKRKRVECGPYPHVTLFEAANRIMSDLVILHGVRFLLHSGSFPFASYKVELGHENRNSFDITAKNRQQTLVGEAFNVATSFFPVKKSASLKKMRTKASSPSYQLLMFNHDAVAPTYKPRPKEGEYFIMVDIVGDGTRIVTKNSFKTKPLRSAA